MTSLRCNPNRQKPRRGVDQTLTEEWNGVNWSVVGSPNQGTQNNNLYGLTCVSSSSRDTSRPVLSGTVDPASGSCATNRVLILLNHYPPGPCKAATTTATEVLIIVS
jgi:hypothetical protein